MNLSKPLTSIAPSLEGEVLTVLARVRAGFTAPQVVRVMGSGSARGVRNTLNRLVDEGLVNHSQAGHTGIYELNREHLALPYIMGIVNLREEFMKKMGEELAEWEIKPEFAALFGSASRNDMHSKSDVDVFIVAPEAVRGDIYDGLSQWHKQLRDFTDKACGWSGRDVRPFVLTPDKVKVELSLNGSTINAIADAGRAFFGDPDFIRKARKEVREVLAAGGNFEVL